ncbi:Pentatricopeptide repeat-containing protein, chloroplastic [Ananas comosus]|uniref:Pentatricopeptide repeat-containing protein, chloroplastic n=1 Tax=Ananas comosus TaxID=4615 RepID=A0A199W3C4_ANACO|nr:Pentatricopeptide repeat-containing protein, chloroplastic [Ananas comosus]
MELYFTNLCNWSSEHATRFQVTSLSFSSSSAKKIEPFLGFDPFLLRKKLPFWGGVKCCSSSSSLERGLKPKPMPRIKPIVETPEPKSDFDDAHSGKTGSSSLCDQIEKWVFFGRYEEALELFEFLRCKSNIVVGSSTYDSLVNACIGLGSIRAAKMVFRHMLDTDFEFDQYMRNRILQMHLKCGMLVDARRLFDEMPERSAVSWTTMITGLIDAGSYEEAFELFLLTWQEQLDAGPRMFATVVRAAAGVGSVSAGRQLHTCVAKMGLYGNVFISCALIDMYSKCGCIEEAQWVFDEMPEKTVVGWNSIIAGYALHGYSERALELYYEMQSSNNAPFRPTANMWAALLTACRIHKNSELGKFAAEKLFGMEPEKLNNYIVLLNIYSSSNRMEDAATVLETLKRKGLRLLPACSWIEVRKKPFGFLFGDKSHPQSVEIYRRLDELMEEIKQIGYVSDEKTLLPDVGENEQRLSKHHSEKLAIAFGLINTPASTPLQIAQGHRLCSDCHNVIKLATIVTKREIVGKHLRVLIFECKEPVHQAYKLGLAAAVLLAMAHALANLLGGCVCICSQVEFVRSSTNRQLAAMTLLLSWIALVIGFSMLMIGALGNSKSRASCGFSHRHVLSMGGIVCFIHGLLAVAYYVTATAAAWEEGKPQGHNMGVDLRSDRAS